MDTTDINWVMDDGQASTPRTRKKPMNKRKIEFVGWGSRELIEFLNSIGKDTTKVLTHYDVTNIVTQYVIDSKLIHPGKKKRVICDARLQTLFGGRKQSVFRNKIHDLLEPHLVENRVASEDDTGSSDEDDTATVSKRQKVSTSEKTLPKKKVAVVPKSALIAISPENIKLVYLKRSLVKELLSDQEKFESKLVGSFVKIEADKFDMEQKNNSHQLQPVIGVIKVASAGDDKPPMLRLDGIMDDIISISALSDENFSEEECEDLRRRIKVRLLKHPTVGELEQKVVMLHEDITKHWLARELKLLKIRMDQANEKGWRHRVTEYLDRRRLLQTPEEQSRLLNEIPKVLPEKVEPEAIPDESPDGENQNPEDSPKAAEWDWEAIGVSTKVSSMQGIQEFANASFKSSHFWADDPLEVGTGINSDTRPISPQEDSPLETEQKIIEYNWDFKSVPLNGIAFNGIQAPQTELNGHTKVFEAPQTDSIGQLLLNSEQGNSFPNDLKPKNVEVITLSDDEDEQELPSNTTLALRDPEPSAWYYLDPEKNVQGPFLLSDLKRWSDSRMFFPPDFRVWSSGMRPHEAVLLRDVLEHVFPSY